MFTRICAVLFLLSLLAQAAAADEVTLQNGDRYTGEVVAMTADHLEFKTPGGLLKIDRKTVKSLIMETLLDVQVEGEKPVRTALRTDAKGMVKLGGKTVPLSKVASIAPPPVGIDEKDRWSGNVGLSITLTDGNSRTRTIHGEVKVTRDQTGSEETLRNRFTAGITYDYGEAEGDMIKNSGWAGGKLEVFIFAGFGAYLDGSVTFDEPAAIERRSRGSFGAAWSGAVADLKLDLSLGFAYIDTIYDETPNRRETDPYLALTLGLAYVLPLEFEFTFKGELTPNLSDMKRYFATAEGAISKKLTDGWFVRLSVRTAYDSHPAADKLRLDTTTFISLVFKF